MNPGTSCRGERETEAEDKGHKVAVSGGKPSRAREQLGGEMGMSEADGLVQNCPLLLKSAS